MEEEEKIMYNSSCELWCDIRRAKEIVKLLLYL